MLPRGPALAVVIEELRDVSREPFRLELHCAADHGGPAAGFGGGGGHPEGIGPRPRLLGAPGRERDARESPGDVREAQEARQEEPVDLVDAPQSGRAEDGHHQQASEL